MLDCDQINWLWRQLSISEIPDMEEYTGAPNDNFLDCRLKRLGYVEKIWHPRIAVKKPSEIKRENTII